MSPTKLTLSDFNSIKVRLKLMLIRLMLIQLSYFNSIKVRLKPVGVNSLQIRKQFQFHKGTIKTYVDNLLAVGSEISIP